MLAFVQFSKRGGFTHKIGSFVISGHNRTGVVYENLNNPNEYFLEGDVHVLFGGMDFCLVNGNDGRSLSLFIGDESLEALPEHMIVSDSEDVVTFTFTGGTELIFTALRSGKQEELRITGVFSEEVTGIELPFKLQRRAGVRNTGDGSFIINFGGANYSFGNSSMDIERRLLILNLGAYLSYGIIPELKTFSPDDFILPEAEVAEAYNMAVTRWRERVFSLWNHALSEYNNEDLVVAFIVEALSRGSYAMAVEAVPASFLGSSARTYESSVYVGALDQASRSLVAVEREKLNRLSRQINEKSLEFLLEPRVFEYLALHGYTALISAGAELAGTIEPDILALDLVPGILEGYLDWNLLGRDEDNPFENLTGIACSLIFESLLRTSDGNSGYQVFVSYGEPGYLEFNLRLGKALLAYAESVQNNSWAGIGRSLILSALYGSSGESSGSSVFESARLYRVLSPVDAYPRTVTMLPQGTRAWTTALAISTAQQNDILDISVSFLAGGTHYMIVRGIGPFSRIQLYDMDFRMDSQFERYDSSGWNYVSQEQTLLLKMRHRNPVEHVRIIFREELRPAPPPPPPPPPLF
jgi:hypothetical protein